MDNIKKIIEEKSKLQIRKSFDKFLEKTLEYFKIKNIDTISENDAITIVKFINNSNSIFTKSYYILRTDMKESEYLPIIKTNIDKLVNSSYKNKTRKNVSINMNKNNLSRGYSGWVKINNNKYYVRSSQEFIYIHYLIENNKDSIFKMEDKIYYYKNYTYKPDIFEYIDNKLIRIYEVKDDFNKFNDNKYKEGEEYFENIGIEFVKLYEGNLILKQNKHIKILLEDWKKNIIRCKNINYSLNNPMNGIKHKQSTKDKISKKAKERQTDEYRQQTSQNTKKYFQNNPDARLKLSLSMKDRFRKKRELKDLKDPFIIKKCVICGEEFKCRTRSKKTTCATKGSSCSWKLTLKQKKFKVGPKKGSMKICYENRIINYAKKIKFTNIEEYNNELQKAKKNKIIPEKFGMSIKVIEIYFNTFDNFLNKINEINENL